MTSEHSIPVGYVRRAHGIGGDVVVRGLISDAGDRIVPDAELVTDEDAPRTMVISSVRLHKGDYLVCLEGVDSKSDADALVGVQFVIDAADRRELDEDEWWAEDLEGRAVKNSSGGVIGTVVDTVTGAAQDRLVIKHVDGQTFELPFVAELVPEVDDTHIVVEIPDGLFG